jgi:transcriptional regulator with XRE-family HTH domain
VVERTLQAIVAENIRSRADEKAITLDRLADFAGVSRRQLYNFLAGKHDITLGWLAKIAKALQIDPETLLAAPK